MWNRALAGVLRRVSTRALPGTDATSALPLHVKDVGTICWANVSEWLRLSHHDLLARFEEHLRWFNDEDFLRERTKDLPRDKRESQWAALEDDDVELLLEKKRIRQVEEGDILAWCLVFTVIEALKMRRRLITAPELNEGVMSEGFDDIEIAQPETATLAVCMDTAFTMDFPWWFGQFPLPVECQRFYGFKHRSSAGKIRFFVLTSVPTGSRFVPLIAQTISVALCREASRGLSSVTGVPELALDSCLDNNRISGREWLVREAYLKFENLTRSLGLSTESPVGVIARNYEFLGVHYCHVSSSIRLAKSMQTKLQNLACDLMDVSSSAACKWTLREALRALSILIYCSRVYNLRAAKYFHVFACLRRRVSKSRRLEESLDSRAMLWSAASSQMRQWTTDLLNIQRITITASPPPGLVTIFTDASETGWGAVVFQNARVATTAQAMDLETFKDEFPLTQGGRFAQQEIIAVLEGRAAFYGICLALRLSPRPTHLTILVDNESLRMAAIKGRSRNFHLNRILIQINELDVAIRWLRIPTANNLADCITRL